METVPLLPHLSKTVPPLPPTPAYLGILDGSHTATHTAKHTATHTATHTAKHQNT